MSKIQNGPDGAKAIGTTIHKLLGEDEIPAGLFRDPSMEYLSGIIFSNAATIAKFNRMGYLAGWQPGDLRMIRQGILFDRTPGALEPIDFPSISSAKNMESCGQAAKHGARSLKCFIILLRNTLLRSICYRARHIGSNPEAKSSARLCGRTPSSRRLRPSKYPDPESRRGGDPPQKYQFDVIVFSLRASQEDRRRSL
jgi:hypothetical protein